MIKNRWILVYFIACFPFLVAQSEEEKLIVRKIYEQALSSGKSYEGLRLLCKEVGSRLSGSIGAEKAVRWAEHQMKAEGFDSVVLQEVLVPCWTRGGKEVAKIVEGEDLSICALGGSVPTGSEGIQAPVVEVKSFEDLKNLGAEKIQGRIVFFNRPMDAKLVNTFTAYGGAVDQRVNGAKEASLLGAVAVIVRSMTLALDDVPHTGMLRYAPDIKPIPAVAISTKGAELLSASLKNKPDLQVWLQLFCQTLPDVLSYNVIGEYRGSEFPNEYMLVSGHLDSWDLGEGAHDDGAGCLQAIEVVLLFKALGIKPKRTIRVVLFMNEENGLKGATKYAEQSKAKKEKHSVALESDAGGFSPRGFRIDASEKAFQKIMQWKTLLEPYGIHDIAVGGGGADIGPLKEQGVPLIGLQPDSQRYFDVHHSTKDVFEQVNPRELALGSATLASILYLIDKHGLD